MPKKPENLIRSEKFSNVARLFWLYFGTPKKNQKNSAPKAGL